MFTLFTSFSSSKIKIENNTLNSEKGINLEVMLNETVFTNHGTHVATTNPALHETVIEHELPPELVEELLHFATSEQRNIQKEKHSLSNQPRTFTGGGELGEIFTYNMYKDEGFIGSASKGGMAFDIKKVNKETGIVESAKEVKFVCLEGTKECNSCKYKSPRFQQSCVYCGKNELNLKNDSRAGISTSAHVKYKHILDEYIIFVMKYDEKQEIISLETYKFLSSNTYFDKYIQNQYDSGNEKGGSCNFLPYSYDWYLSAPIKVLNVEINISQETPILRTLFYNTNANTIEKIPTKIFKKNELEKLNFTTSDTPYMDYEFVMNSGITIRNKTIGKSRGDVSRK